MKKKRLELRKTKRPQLNKALINIEDTLNDIDDKLDDLRELDKGSKAFTIIGLLLMGLGGGGILTITTIFKNFDDLLSYIIIFISSTLFVITMLLGFALAHKGMTGDWL